jgi:predicted RNA binding protein YcfA (HicA-like mRNA interferase family)
MTRLPIVSAKTMEKVLLKLGFVFVRQKGSHAVYRNPDGQTAILAKHKGRDIPRSVLHEMLRQIKVSPDEFIKLTKDI